MKELLAPNGNPSNLTPEQYKLVRTPEFKQWFGDWENDPANASKVVGENGEPKVVYHGTQEEFSVFMGGSYFTDDYMNADGYASGEIILEVFLSIKNPLIINARGRKWDDLKSKYGTTTQEITQKLDNQKYNGVIFYNINDNWFDDEGEPQNVYFTINSNQIKLADGTNTKFDGSNPDIRFEGGGIINNPTEIECLNCHWHWKVKDGGDDLFICHKCYFDNSKFYTFSGLKGEEILSTIKYKKGGRTISQTPAPKKDQVVGSDKNKPESSKNVKSAKQIEFNEKTLETIKNKVAEHNKNYPNKEITLSSAKAVVRRGFGAYSSTHRPTISGGKPNSRVAWGLARLNAFTYKIINGKSKSGKYKQDDDLINELGYKVEKYEDGGLIGDIFTKNTYRLVIGGEIKAYEQALDITYSDGGETKPKKVYVSIQLPYEIKKLWKAGERIEIFNKYLYTYNELPFEELKNGKLKGLVGVSSSPNNIAEWFISRDCLIVMDYDDFLSINQTQIINYDDPYQLMKNNLFLFKRLYANVSRYGEQENVYRQTLVKILEKVIVEINLEKNVSQGQKANELYRISRFINPYETRAFPDWLEKNSIVIQSPIDLTNAILQFNKIDDSYLGSGFENPILTFDELLPIIEKGVTNASKIYESEQEIVLVNRELNIPKKSQLFFIGKNELDVNVQSNKLELIEKYNLKVTYKIHFVDRSDLEKYRSIWLKKQEEKYLIKQEEGREDLQKKKQKVAKELIDYFFQQSINQVIENVNKEIKSYGTDSLYFYNNYDDEYIEILWKEIPLVKELFQNYESIVYDTWNELITNKSVDKVNLYSFIVFQDEAYRKLKEYIEKNRDKYDELSNYRNVKGQPSLQLSLFEYDFYTSVYDYKDLPEWINYKQLAKMYLEKMGRELYRYYDKNDLKLISDYEKGGITNDIKINEMLQNTENLIEKYKIMNQLSNPTDTITMDIPLLIRFSELMREDIKSDVQLHKIIENMIEIKDKGVLTMDDYASIIGTDVKLEEEKMEDGGNVNVIKSKKGDIQISLDENWYSDDSSVELVPVSELIKFREFDRKVNPKYNQDNSFDNIFHLIYMFQKQGVKSPLIIEYSPEDNVVLLTEGNHRLNSAIDLGMEYLPARVVLRKFGKLSPSKIKKTMQVVGIEPNKNNFIPSDLKPSHIGIAGTKSLAYADGGIIEGRLHSECGEDGCGRKFQVGENGHIIEAERDEAVIVADAFNENEKYTIEGTPSEVASALNVLGGGKSFDKGAVIIKNGEELEIPLLKTQAKDTDVDDVIDSGSIIINRRSMADDKEYQVTGTPKQIASAINSLDGNGVVIENGAEIKEN